MRGQGNDYSLGVAVMPILAATAMQNHGSGWPGLLISGMQIIFYGGFLIWMLWDRFSERRKQKRIDDLRHPTRVWQAMHWPRE